MLSTGAGGTFYSSKLEGIVVIFKWGSLQESQLNDYFNQYLSRGWNSLVLFNFLNSFIRSQFGSRLLLYIILNSKVVLVGASLRCRFAIIVRHIWVFGSLQCHFGESD